MKNFRQGGGGSFRPSWGDRGQRRDNRGDRPAMHRSVCSECGNNCEVPFRPTGDKPIYCNDCFSKIGGRSPRRDFDRDRSARPSFASASNDSSDLKKELRAISTKLDLLIGSVEKLTVTATSEQVKPEATLADSVKKATKAKKEVAKKVKTAKKK